MTKLFGPFGNGAGASIYEAQWSKMMRTVFKDGVVNGYLDELLAYGDSTGMLVKVKAGGGWIKGHYYENDAEETIAISAANAAYARWDYVALEVDWTKSDNQMSVVVVQGTPAASPALPTLIKTTSKWQIPLAKIVVGAGVTTITAGNVTDLRQLVSYMYLNGKIHRQLVISGFKPTKTNGCGYPIGIEMATNKNVYDCLPFDPNSIEYAYANLPLPQDYSGGDIFMKPFWTHPATTTNFKVSWGLSAVAIGGGASLDAAQGTPQYSNDIGGTTSYLYTGPLTAAITIAGTPVPEKLVQFRASRKADDATNDTLAVDAYLINYLVWYPVA